MYDWSIITETNINYTILIVIFSIFFIIFTIIYLINKQLGKLALISYFLRLGMILPIMLFLLNPILTYKYEEEVLLDVPIIFDSSFSMADSINLNNENKSKIEYSKELISQYIINSSIVRNKVNTIIYNPIDNHIINNINDIITNGVFDISIIPKLMNNKLKTYPYLILVTDLYIPDSDFELISNNNLNDNMLDTPIYIFSPQFNVNEILINDISYNEKKRTISLNAKTDGNIGKQLNVTVNTSEKELYNENLIINSNEVLIDIPLPRNLYGLHIFEVKININNKYDNTLNNVDYIEINLNEEHEIPTIHYFFEKPTFTTAFISRIINSSDDLKLNQYYPNYKGEISPNINFKNNDIIILQDLTNDFVLSLDDRTRNNIKNHIYDNGKTILLFPNKNPLIIQKQFFPNINIINTSVMNNNINPNKESPLKLTDLGLDKEYLTFNSKYRAQDYWDRLDFFYPPAYEISVGKDGEILSLLDNLPVIISSKKMDITLFTLAGLWKIDFKNLSFGIESHYLPNMIIDLLTKKKDFFDKDSKIIINDRILEYGESTVLFFNKDYINQDSIRIINDKEDYMIYPKSIDESLKIDFKPNLLGKHEIYYKNELLDTIYVKYPSKERTSANYEKAKIIAQNSGGSVITNNFENFGKILEKETKIIIKKGKINLYNPYIFFILIIIFLGIDWIIKKRNLI